VPRTDRWQPARGFATGQRIGRVPSDLLRRVLGTLTLLESISTRPLTALVMRVLHSLCPSMDTRMPLEMRQPQPPSIRFSAPRSGPRTLCTYNGEQSVSNRRTDGLCGRPNHAL
jgi:hypothetical protein